MRKKINKDSTSYKNMASNVRYKNDKSFDSDISFDNSVENIKDHLFRSGLLIDDNSTPELSEKLGLVSDKLGVPKDMISAFVYASSDIQASCIATSQEQCILNFSSGLVNLLDFEEFSFIAGHELGHFIFDHNYMPHKKESIELFMQKRAQEISVDRLGLIGCGDLNASVRALIKTTSGLDNKFLKFDVGQFISQASKISNPHLGEGLGNTHPSMIVRCRALLWFSTLDSYSKYPIPNRTEEIDQIDIKIGKDFIKYVDGPAKEIINFAKSQLAMWIVAEEIIKDKKFDKDEQEKFIKLFGNTSCNKMKIFLKDFNTKNINKVVKNKITHAKSNLEELIPITFNEHYIKLKSDVTKYFLS